MKEPNQNIIATEEEDLQENDGLEVCRLMDSSLGLTCELHSKKLTADKLLDLCGAGMDYLKSNRTKSIPSMVG